jgi:hypothetical protein
MKNKSVTKAVLAANRANAKKSPGPRTATGKLKASRNALTHRFFARELILNDDEKRQLEISRRRLESELAPRTELQHIAFAEIIACLGRCMLALRLEMRHISRILSRDDAQQGERDRPDRRAGSIEWYLAGKQGLRTGMQILEGVKQEFLTLGRIDEKSYILLDETFGPRLRQLLTEWLPPNPDATLLAHHLTEHAKTFNKPLPPLGSDKDGPEVILDPNQSVDMVIKLLEMQGLMLSDLCSSSEQRVSEFARTQNDTVDFAPRYFSAACRDLHRAIDRFMDLKKNKL